MSNIPKRIYFPEILLESDRQHNLYGFYNLLFFLYFSIIFLTEAKINPSLVPFKVAS